MRWHIFAIFAFLMLVLEIGLRPLLHLDMGGTWVCPSFLLVLAAFIALWAPPSTIYWGALVLGFLLDLRPLPIGEDLTVAAIIGPATVGFLFGAYAIVQFRGMVYRDSPFAVAAMAFVGGIFINLVIVALLTFRGLPLPFLADPIAGWSAADQLYQRFLQLIYTTILAIPLGWLLLRYHSIWGFETGKGIRR